MNRDDLDNLICAWIDGRLTEADSDLLQQNLIESEDSRHRFRELAALDSAMRDLALTNADPLATRIFPRLDSAQPEFGHSEFAQPDFGRSGAAWGFNANWLQMAAAFSMLILVGAIAYSVGKSESPQPIAQLQATEGGQSPEKTISGHATLHHVAGIKWADESASYLQGDVLPAGLLEFDEGVAEIDFFCGATVVVEGPAKLVLESDWSARLLSGRLRANVPPAARGFIVRAADSEVIDLGTEFALEVQSDFARVEVIDGEIELRGGRHDGQHLVTGEAQAIVGAEEGVDSLGDLSTIVDVRRRHAAEQKERFTQWKAETLKQREDARLIAYYPIAESTSGQFVANAAASGDELDGKIVGPVQRTDGRFGLHSSSLDFARPGSRVRALIDGEFDAFSFACWARIDGLDHQYNALFMSDGYENGELHWQIHNDGRMMFSVMVDDTPGSGYGPLPDARLHRIYYTDPVWDITRSGKWVHLAAVYDPLNRVVQQYVNGHQVSSEVITDRFFVEKLRIGPAEIGNWGQPLRKSPDFAVRNLNGGIDEMAIFGEALKADEIKQLYENGKPFGY